MQSAQPSLFTREDTIFGACEGIGEDFGFNPQYLRAGLAAMLFWSPVAALATYAAIALAVFIARWLYPAASPELAGAASPIALERPNEPAPTELAMAA